MEYLDNYKAFNESAIVNKENLKEMGLKVYELISKDDRVKGSFIWGSFFEKINPSNINIIIELNVQIGQFDDKMKMLSSLQEHYYDVYKSKNEPLDITVISKNKGVYRLFPHPTSSEFKTSVDREESYNNLDEGRPIKPLSDIID